MSGGREKAVEDAAYAGMRSMEELVRLMSENPENRREEEEEGTCVRVADTAVAKFRKVISLLDRSRTGHARFRRSSAIGSRQEEATAAAAKEGGEEKVEEVVPVKVYCPKPIQWLPALRQHQNPARVFAASSLTASTASSSAFQVMARPPSTTAGGEQVPPPPPPPPPSSSKRKCASGGDQNGGNGGRCHCSNPKRSRKTRVRRTVRVPAVSAKSSDIPPDDFSWRKYGQKPIKGSPYPRGYYKCSSVRGCPARKHVERAVDDPSMLIVTYEGDHNHETTSHFPHNPPSIAAAAPTPTPASVSSPPSSSPPPPPALPQPSS